MPPRSSHARALKGAVHILKYSLRLTPGDVLGLLWDETTKTPARVLMKAAASLGLDVHDRMVSRAIQRSFDAQTGLSFEDQDVLADARAVITCLNADGASTDYRAALLKFGTTDGKRIGHMPGADLRLLTYAASIDFDRSEQRCDDLALALTLGRCVQLQTYVYDARGRIREEHDLECTLGGLRRPPISSTGVIPLGTWGNIPGGESFVAPLENTARGTFVLNGAFRGRVMRRAEQLLLSFDLGRVTAVAAPEELERLFHELFRPARAQGDGGWDALAELGIGVNEGIRRLTGNSLFDEKCAGTVHIALGDNTRYGGVNASHIHEDLVSRGPSLWLDGKPLLDHGRDRFSIADWYASLSTTEPDPALVTGGVEIRRTSVQALISATGMFRLRRHVAAGRHSEYQIADVATSTVLATIYRLTPTFPFVTRLPEIQSAASVEGIDHTRTAIALTILVRHGVIDFAPSFDRSPSRIDL